MQAAHDTVIEKLGKLRSAPGIHNNPVFQAILDQIEVLTRPYMVPVQGEEWVKYRLTTQEMRVACLLHTRLGKLVTRDGLLDAMWFDDPEGGKAPKNLDVVLCRVRQKIANDYTIEPIFGRGYIMHRVIPQAEQVAA
jgi:DNA-binding response OmpR family regulator